MKWIAVPILILLIMSQSFSNWFVVLNFQLNREYISSNLCENRAQPKLQCKGNCVLLKKLQQQQKQENKSSLPLKIDAPVVILYSKVFFPTVPTVNFTTLPGFNSIYRSGETVDMTFTVFHPPSA